MQSTKEISQKERGHATSVLVGMTDWSDATKTDRHRKTEKRVECEHDYAIKSRYTDAERKLANIIDDKRPGHIGKTEANV